jgi:hypothetical protein
VKKKRARTSGRRDVSKPTKAKGSRKGHKPSRRARPLTFGEQLSIVQQLERDELREKIGEAPALELDDLSTPRVKQSIKTVTREPVELADLDEWTAPAKGDDYIERAKSGKGQDWYPIHAAGPTWSCKYGCPGVILGFDGLESHRYDCPWWWHEGRNETPFDVHGKVVGRSVTDQGKGKVWESP